MRKCIALWLLGMILVLTQLTFSANYNINASGLANSYFNESWNESVGNTTNFSLEQPVEPLTTNLTPEIIQNNSEVGDNIPEILVEEGNEAGDNIILDDQLSLLASPFIESEFKISAFSGAGTGTLADPYVITNCTQLVEINNSLGSNYSLGNDIDCSDTVNWNNNQGWSPLAPTNAVRFTQTLDGQGYDIIGLHMNRTTNNVGLFGYADDFGNITNFDLIGVDMKGGSYVGGIVSYNFGAMIYKVSVQGNISGADDVAGFTGVNSAGKIIASYFSGNVTGTGGMIGGIVGDSGGTSSIIELSYSEGTVRGAGTVGGLIARNYGAIKNSYSRANVSDTSISLGGFVGSTVSGSSITHSYAAGNVTGSNAIYTHGFGESGGTFTADYWDTQTSGIATTGSFGRGTPKTTAQMKDVATFTTSSAWDFVDNPNNDAANNDYWDIDPLVNDGYPALVGVGVGEAFLTPRVSLNSPSDSYYFSESSATEDFNCSVTSANVLANISLYITDMTNSSFILNATAIINGTSNESVWNIEFASGNYTWNCLSYDTTNRFDWGVNRTIIADVNAPEFSVFANQSVSSGNSVAYDIDVTDDISGAACFTVNDTTNFQINCSGYLENNTVLSVQQYWLNITVNDSARNHHSENFWVNITPVPAIGLTTAYPTTDIDVSQNQTFNVTVIVTCFNADCGVINVSLDPIGGAGVNYTEEAYDGNYNEYDCSDSATSGNDDSVRTITTLGFDFPYFGTTKTAGTDIYMDTNGRLSWSDTSSDFSPSESEMKSEENIAANWQDLGAGSVNNEYKCVNQGSAPNRYAVFRWDSQWYSSAGSAQMEVVLYETGVIDINYGDIATHTDTWIRGFSLGNNKDFYYNTSGSISSTQSNKGWRYTPVSVASTKSGLVSTTSGDTPFWTNTTNPYNVSLNAGESINITFWVNATGDINTNHTFFFYANQSSDMTVSNVTVTWNVTITNSTGTPAAASIDALSPSINFTYPTLGNATSTSNTSVQINVSIVESNLTEITWNWNGSNYTLYNGSLALQFNFDNLSSLGENNTHVFDVSKGGNNGTLYNGTMPNSSGRYNGGMQFDGIDDYIELPNSGSLNITSPITISLWEKTAADMDITATWGMLLIGRGTYGDPRNTMDLRIGPGGESALFGYEYDSGTNSNYANGTTDIADGNWHFVVGQWNGSNCLVYVNGVLESSVSCTNTPGPFDESFVIGKAIGVAFGQDEFNGTIDEVKMWNRSLSSDEIYQQYVSSLNKLNQTQWYLYVNQSLNASNNLTDGAYTYFASAQDGAGNQNVTDIRTVTIDTTPALPDTTAPLLNFTYPTLDNATTTSNISVQVNVSIVESNLTEIKWNWNGTNYTFYNDSLVLLYNFDNLSSLGENNTHVFDISKGGNNGTAINGASFTTSGKYYGAFDFDGSNDEIKVPTTFGLRATNFSIATWVNLDSTSEGGAFVKIGGTSPNVGFAIGVGGSTYDNNGNDLILLYEGVRWIDTNDAIGTGWHHVAMTINSSGYPEAFIDGQLTYRDSLGAGTAPQQSITYLGGYTGSTGENRHADVTMDNTYIFTRTLSSTEIYQLFVSSLGKFNQTQWYLYVNQSLNATANLTDGSYTYFASAKDGAGNENVTDTRSVTINTTPVITDTTAPLLILLAPANNTNSSNTTLSISYVASDETAVSTCWYTNDTMTNNITLVGCSNITTVTWSEGEHNITIWVNDTSANTNSSSVTFTIDSTSPSLTIISPANNTYSSNNSLTVNYVASDLHRDSCWYANGSSSNSTLSGCANLSSTTWLDGQHNITIWVNDTFGNVNSSSVTFTIDTVVPLLSIISPSNNSNSSNNSLAVNYVASDETAISTCWYSNDTMTSNTTLVGCVNITSLTWLDGQHNVTIWVNDTSANTNSSSVTFTIDSTSPSLTIISPANNTYSSNNSLTVNYVASDLHRDSCWYANGTSSNSTLSGCANLSSTTWLDGQHNITIWVNDTFGNVNSSSVTFTIDTDPPKWANNKTNLTSTTTLGKTVYFNITLNDTNPYQYIFGFYNGSDWVNDTPTIYTTGQQIQVIKSTATTTENINWTFYFNDSAGNVNQTDIWGILMNATDADDDGVADLIDPLLWNETNVTKSGITNLNITIAGNKTNGVFSGKQEVLFRDQKTLLVNFTHNFSQSNLDLSKITLARTSTSLLINLNGQLQSSYNKTLYLADNSFISLCVKNQEISSIDEVSSGCDGSNETEFSSCLGGSLGSQGINCTDEGATIRIDNLQYSAVRGTQASVTTSPSAASGGGGGSGRGKTGGLILEEPECTIPSDCRDDKTCFQNKCVKLFDIAIVAFNSSANQGGFFDFTYYAIGMANISGDVEFNFWIEKEEEVVSAGKDVIYFGNFEEKTRLGRLLIPSVVEPGVYRLVVELRFENYNVDSFRTIEIKVADEVLEITEVEQNLVGGATGDLSTSSFVISLLLVGIMLMLIIVIFEKNKLVGMVTELYQDIISFLKGFERRTGFNAKFLQWYNELAKYLNITTLQTKKKLGEVKSKVLAKKEVGSKRETTEQDSTRRAISEQGASTPEHHGDDISQPELTDTEIADQRKSDEDEPKEKQYAGDENAGFLETTDAERKLVEGLLKAVLSKKPDKWQKPLP